MIDTVTMVLALMSGSIFLAHALDGLRSRAWSRCAASIAKQRRGAKLFWLCAVTRRSVRSGAP